MRITETTLPGAFVVDVERHEDERGFFARSSVGALTWSKWGFRSRIRWRTAR